MYPFSYTLLQDLFIHQWMGYVENILFDINWYSDAIGLLFINYPINLGFPEYEFIWQPVDDILKCVVAYIFIGSVAAFKDMSFKICNNYPKRAPFGVILRPYP